MRFREADQMLKNDGWYVADISGSHYQYKHPEKPRKVSVPNHSGDISIVTLILLCPRMDCNVFGCIPDSAHLVANVCINVCMEKCAIPVFLHIL